MKCCSVFDVTINVVESELVGWVPGPSTMIWMVLLTLMIKIVSDENQDSDSVIQPSKKLKRTALASIENVRITYTCHIFKATHSSTRLVVHTYSFVLQG
jgi:hypothetical protein